MSRWFEACATPPPSEPRSRLASDAAAARSVAPCARSPWGPARAVARRGVARVRRADGVPNAVNFLAAATCERRLPRGVRSDAAPAHCERATCCRGRRRTRAGRGVLAIGGADFDRANGDPRSPRRPPPARSAGRRGCCSSRRCRDARRTRQVATLGRLARRTPTRTTRCSRAPRRRRKRSAARARRRVLRVATQWLRLGARAEHARPPGTFGGVGAVVSGDRAPAARPRAALLPGSRSPERNARRLRAGRFPSHRRGDRRSTCQGAEWAVLSACETGLSDPARPEPCRGLRARVPPHRRAHRGAHEPVGGGRQHARLWMTQLYARGSRRRLDTAESVRAAWRASLREARAAARRTCSAGRLRRGRATGADRRPGKISCAVKGHSPRLVAGLDPVTRPVHRRRPHAVPSRAHPAVFAPRSPRAPRSRDSPRGGILARLGLARGRAVRHAAGAATSSTAPRDSPAPARSPAAYVIVAGFWGGSPVATTAVDPDAPMVPRVFAARLAGPNPSHRVDRHPVRPAAPARRRRETLRRGRPPRAPSRGRPAKPAATAILGQRRRRTTPPVPPACTSRASGRVVAPRCASSAFTDPHAHPREPPMTHPIRVFRPATMLAFVIAGC